MAQLCLLQFTTFAVLLLRIMTICCRASENVLDLFQLFTTFSAVSTMCNAEIKLQQIDGREDSFQSKEKETSIF